MPLRLCAVISIPIKGSRIKAHRKRLVFPLASLRVRSADVVMDLTEGVEGHVRRRRSVAELPLGPVAAGENPYCQKEIAGGMCDDRVAETAFLFHDACVGEASEGA